MLSHSGHLNKTAAWLTWPQIPLVVLYMAVFVSLFTLNQTFFRTPPLKYSHTALVVISITRSELKGTQLRVEGNGALPNTAITINGTVMGTSDASGLFKIQNDPFSSATCQITVSDGSSSATATLSGCTLTAPTATPTPLLGAPTPSLTLSSLSLSTSSVTGSTSLQGTVILTGPAPAGGATVTLSSGNTAIVLVPTSVVVPAASTSVVFPISTNSGSTTVTVSISASYGGVTSTASLTVVTTALPLTISTVGLTCTNGVCALGPGNVGTFFAQFPNATGGKGPTPFKWTLIAGRLPSGLSMPSFYGVQSTIISGTPTTVETTTFTIQVQDGVGAKAQQAFTLTINPPRPLVITNQSSILPAGNVGVSYAVQLFADGGVQPYQWVLVTGQLPSGLTLSSAGRISGIPTTTGTFAFTVHVTDKAGAQATGQFSITISP